MLVGIDPVELDRASSSSWSKTTSTAWSGPVRPPPRDVIISTRTARRPVHAQPAVHGVGDAGHGRHHGRGHLDRPDAAGWLPGQCPRRRSGARRRRRVSASPSTAPGRLSGISGTRRRSASRASVTGTSGTCRTWCPCEPVRDRLGLAAGERADDIRHLQQEVVGVRAEEEVRSRAADPAVVETGRGQLT